jgi:hypothetical protein
MKKIMGGLAVLALASLARAMMPATAQADPFEGHWEQVCCGAHCTGGIDYCTGTGTFTCCKT